MRPRIDSNGVRGCAPGPVVDPSRMSSKGVARNGPETIQPGRNQEARPSRNLLIWSRNFELNRLASDMHPTVHVCAGETTDNETSVSRDLLLAFEGPNDFAMEDNALALADCYIDSTNSMTMLFGACMVLGASFSCVGAFSRSWRGYSCHLISFQCRHQHQSAVADTNDGISW